MAEHYIQKNRAAPGIPGCRKPDYRIFGAVYKMHGAACRQSADPGRNAGNDSRKKILSGGKYGYYP
jgi:hypothetical protein